LKRIQYEAKKCDGLFEKINMNSKSCSI